MPLSERNNTGISTSYEETPKGRTICDRRTEQFLICQSSKASPKLRLITTPYLFRMVKKYNKHHKDNPLPHITPHTLRHTFCTRLASKNMNPKDLQYIMGHSNISITMNWYAHASIDTAKSEVQRLIA